MAVEREKGYEYRGWKLGEKVKWKINNTEHTIIGFFESALDVLSYIALDCVDGYQDLSKCSSTTILKDSICSRYIWVGEDDIEKIESDVENAKSETFDSCINKLKQVDEENKEMLKEIKQCKHYSDTGIEPIEFIIANNYGFNQGNIVKYNHRIGKKKGQEVSDIKKIIDYALLLAYEKGIELNEDELIDLIKYRFFWIKERKNGNI